MLVKSRTSGSHVDDLETFAALCRYHMNLNPAKCTFRVMPKKFLRFMMLRQEIEANPKKVQAMRQMGAPMTVKCSGSQEGLPPSVKAANGSS